MSVKEKQLLEEVDKTLKAFDNLPKLETNPHLFTRIQAKDALGGKLQKKFSLKPVALGVIVILNIITAIYFFNSSGKDYTKDQIISSLSEDYNIKQNNF